MRLVVGSENRVKIEAVREVIQDYDIFYGAEIVSMNADSDVSDQPSSLEETVNGAVNRSRNAFNDCDYSFGIESGLFLVPQTRTGKIVFCVCSIYDGERPYLGLSRGFEFPVEIMRMIREDNVDSNEAFFRCGFTESREIGYEEGAIGILTKGRITRKDYTKDAIQMALIQIENKDLY